MVWRASVFRRGFIGASVAWALALPLATFAVSPGHLHPSLYAFALAVYAVGSGICHQIVERSFQPWGHQMPVCARCTGIYVGGAIAAVIASFRTTKVVRHFRADVAQGFPGTPKRAPREGGSPALLVLLLAALPTIATLVFEWTTGITPSNGIRFAAGLPLGAAVAWTIVTVLEDQVN